MEKKYRIDGGKIVEVKGDSSPFSAYLNPSEDEKRYLVETLKIDEHTLACSLDPDELSRLEFEPEHAAIIYSRPRNLLAGGHLSFKVGTVGAFLFKDRLILISTDDVPVLDGAQVARVQTNAGLVIKLILGAIVHFREHLRGISVMADELQGEINRAMENKHLINLFELEKSLVYYLNFVHSNGLLLDKMKHTAAKLGLTQEEEEILDDTIIENAQCYKQAEIYSNILASLMDARASIVSNNLNVMMKNLNALVIAVAVPSFFASVGGMSEFSAVVARSGVGAMWPYVTFLVGMFALGLGTFVLIRRVERHWR